MPNKKALIETKKGTIEVELFADEVPGTVANFEKLANSSFYDGTKFHRVIPNFMIQGGDPYSKTGKGAVGTGGPGYMIKCETQKNTHKHVAGTLSMAHAGKDNGGTGLRRVCREARQRHALARAVHAHRDTAAGRVRDPHAAQRPSHLYRRLEL